MVWPHTGASQTDVPPAQAGQIIDGIAPVGPQNSFYNPEIGMIDVLLVPDPAAARRPVVAKNAKDDASLLLKRLVSRNRAAGMGSLVYDNRDGGHSNVRARKFPQLATTHYSQIFQAEGLDYGAAGTFRFSLPTLGNSSTAVTKGPLARSQARRVLANQAVAMRTYHLFAANNLYFYPEHRDHDPETGDRFFANTPYIVVSQGSSGSDRAFMSALFKTAAALPMETQERLISEGLMAATLQMLLRRSLAGSDAAYLTGMAHPSVFDGSRLDEVDLVTRANALRADEIAPMVRLSVEEDFDAVPGVDYLAGNLGEEIFTTPSAIARAWRSYDYSRALQISAAETKDPNGRPMKFHWSVLRGDPDKVRISPLDDAGTKARIEIDWHDLQQVAAATPDSPFMTSNRIDIGVFADNGVTISAPAFMSVTFPVHQARHYTQGPTGHWQLEELSLFGRGVTKNHAAYADPRLWPVGAWTDRLSRDSAGRLVAIERRYDNSDAGTESFRIGLTGPVRTGEDGTTEPVRHVAVRRADGSLDLVEPDAETAGAPGDRVQ